MAKLEGATTAPAPVADTAVASAPLVRRRHLDGFAASLQVLLCLSCDSRAEVDELVRRAVAAGGAAPMPPQDHGFMYGHGFEDLDGHLWELMHMDPNAVPSQA